MDRSVLRTADLGDGSSLVVRRTTAGDMGRLRALFDSLSFDDRYLRFFSGFRPDDEFLERLANANERGACQLVALELRDGREHVVGEAGAWPLPDGNGELGITVEPSRRGWLGPYLLDALTEVAAQAGMPNLEADVLMTNRPMLAVLRARGYAVTGHDAYRSMRVAIATTGTVPSWAREDARPRVLVETPGGRWRDEDEVREHPWQVVACPGPTGRPAGRPCPALVGRTCPLAVGADVVVVRVPAGAKREQLVEAHRAVHPGVPVCIDDGRMDLRPFLDDGAGRTMNEKETSGGDGDG